MSWQREIRLIHIQAIKKSGIVPWSEEDKRFLALALAGEVGELCNIIKKDWRGDQGDRSLDLRAEFADIRVYLHLLATAYAVELDDEVEAKLPAIRAKFTQAPR